MREDWKANALFMAFSLGNLAFMIFMASLGSMERGSVLVVCEAIITSRIGFWVLHMIIFVVPWGLDKRSGMRLCFPIMCFTSKEYLANHIASLISRVLIVLLCLKVSMPLKDEKFVSIKK